MCGNSAVIVRCKERIWNLATQLYLRTPPWLKCAVDYYTHTQSLGGRDYPVRHYPIAIRLRTRNSTPHQFTKLVGDPVGRAIRCVALSPQSGDSSGATLEVPSEALLHAKCSPYALFLYKNTFFPKKICVCAFFVVPLQPISKESSPDGGIGRRAGLKHQ